MQRISDTAIDESRILAEKYGAFPAWKGSIWKDFPMRNAALTSIAPHRNIVLTGRLFKWYQTVFSFVHSRRNTVNKTFVIVNPVFLESLGKILAEMDLTQEQSEKGWTILSLTCTRPELSRT